MKKILLVSTFIFILALVARVGSYLNVLQTAAGSYQYYQGIGSGNDADYQIKNAIFTITGSGPAETLTHYDYIFLIPSIAFFLKIFGYVKGLEFLMYFIILLGSLVPVILFLLLAKRTPYLVGSLIIGLTFALNPLLVEVSAGRYVLDTLVQFIFALFVVCYLQALEKKSIFWLTLLGVIGVIQGLNKPFLMVNDMALFLIFPLFVLIKKIDYKKQFPFVFIQWQLTKKMFLYSIIPSLIYIIGNITWEVYLHNTIQKGYFLKDIFFADASDSASSTNFALRDSLVMAQTPWEKLRNIIMFAIMALEELKKYMYIPLVSFISILLLYISSKKNRKIWFKWTIILALLFVAIFFISTKLFFIHGVTSTTVPQRWDFLSFISFATLILLFLFFMQRSIPLLGMTAMQIPYLVAVGLSITTAIFPRHYVTLVIWFMICTALLIDSFTPSLLSNFSKHIYRFIIVVIFLIFSPPIFQAFTTFNTNMTKELKNIGYLMWVRKQIPDSGYILAGTGENLINVAKYTKKTVLYNSFHVPTLVTYDDSIHLIKDFGSVDTQPMDFKIFLPKYAKEKKVYVTDLNKKGWENLLTSGSKAEIPKNMYKLEKVEKNPRTGRILYRLVLNKTN